MKRAGLASLLAVLALLLLAPAGRAAAGSVGDGWSFDGGKTFVNEDVTVASDEVFQGPLGIFDGDLTVEAGGRVVGDVFISGGDARVDGEIDGGLAVMSGDITLAAGSSVTGDVLGLDADQDIAGHVGGDLTSVSGDLVLRGSAVVDGNLLGWRQGIEREAGAQVKGQVLRGVPSLPFFPQSPELPGVATPEAPRLTTTPPTAPAPAPRPWTDSSTREAARQAGRVFGVTFSSLVLIAVGVLVVIVWRRPVQRVSSCLAAMPWRSLGLGLLTILIAVGLEVVAALLLALLGVVGGMLSATVILLPLGLLLILIGVLLLLPAPLALIGGMVLGWVGLAELLGRRILHALRVRSVTPLGAALVGLALTIWLPAVLSLSRACCVAWPAVVVLLGSFGLGSVVLTRFGTRPCFPAGRPAAPPGGEALPPEAMDEEAGQPDISA